MKLWKRILLSALIGGLIVPTPSWAAITYTFAVKQGPYPTGGQMRETTGTLNLAGTYETNGFTLTPTDFGLSRIESILLQGEDGYQFFYNPTAKKVIAFQSAGFTPAGTNANESTHTHAVLLDGGVSDATSGGTPSGTNGNESTHTHAVLLDGGVSAATTGGTPAGTVGGSTAAGAAHTHTFTGTAERQGLIVEEVVAIASDTGTLANIPAYIIAAEVTAGGTTGPARVVPTGETPITRQTAVNHATGGLTFAAADAVTSVRVTYLPVRTGTFVVAANFVYDETRTAAAAGVNLANRAAAVAYVWNDTAGTLMTPVPVGEAPGSGEYALDINNSGNTTVTTNAAQDGNTLKVSYLKFAALPSPDMFVDDADLTLTAQAYNFTQTSHFSGLVVPGHGVQLVGEETATNVFPILVGPSGTAANNVAKWQPALNVVTAAQSGTLTTTAVSWLVLPHWAFAGVTPAGTNASESTHTHAATGLTFTGDALATHTHGPGTLADAASGAGSAHTHTFTGDALATHTHGPGTLADAASGAGAAHTHTFTGTAVSAGALTEVANATSLASVDQIQFIVVGH